MTDNPKTPSEVDDDDAKWWLNEIKAAEDRNEEWWYNAELTIERYQDTKKRNFGRLNILWANTETQKSALGRDFGNPEVRRLNAPSNQQLTRHVSRVWEQTIDAAVKETGDNHEIRCAVHDVLLPGRGQVWLELNPIKDETDNVVWVEAPIVRLNYRDYLEGPANRWGAVPWVARGDLFSLDDLKNLLPEGRKKEADDIPRNWSLPMPNDMKSKGDTASQEQFKRARVHEIWAKFPTKRRIYVAEGYDKPLKVTPDPFRLKGFFPCPRPMLANGDEAWQRPLTDYSRYQDQAEEIDRISERIFVLTDTLRRRGIHDKQFKELADLALAGDNVSIAVENWMDLQSKGGLTKAVEWEDLAPTIAVLAQLHQDRQTNIALVYELTGISDLARGMTDPDETLGAQKLKRSYGSSRFQDREKESRRFAADAYAIKGELIAEHFPQFQIQEMSGIALPTMAQKRKAQADLQQMQKLARQAQQSGQPMPFDPYQVEELQEIANAPCPWEKIESVLRTDRRRCYMVEVETDQTAFRDEEADKKARIELLSIIGQLMQQFGPMIAANPANGEFFKTLMMFVVSSFKAGRSVEEGLERSIDNSVQQAAQAGQKQQQDPKAMADAQIAQARVQEAQIGLQREQIQLQTEMVKAQAAGVNIQLDQIQAQVKAGAEQQKLAQGDMKIRQQEQANAAKQAGQAIDMQNRVEQLNFERTQRATAREEILKDRHTKDAQRQQTTQNGTA